MQKNKRKHTQRFYSKVGRKIKVQFFWSQHLHKIHIVAVVEGMVVYRYFGRSKRWWHYNVESWQRIKMYHEQAKGDASSSKAMPEF